MDLIEIQFCDLLKSRGIILTEMQVSQFSDYYEQLVLWNEKMNLTGITDKEEVYIKHFYDSISVSFHVGIDTICSVADIGSGAGFPSLPLKIVFPHLNITIIDSLNKRILFLDHIVKLLELTNVNCVHGRAEDLARDRKYRNQFNLVTARAVAKLNVLNELCLPFTEKDGLFVAMKGSDPTNEISEAKVSLRQLRAEIVDVFDFDLPVKQAKRHLVLIKNLEYTPNLYPRKAGVPLKTPLL